jgi:hypothetical protein
VDCVTEISVIGSRQLERKKIGRGREKTFAHCIIKQLHNYGIVKVYKLDANYIQILLLGIKKTCFLLAAS